MAVVTAQRDRIVASYMLLADVGRLDPRILGLQVQVYQPQVHYMQGRDAWAGMGNSLSCLHSVQTFTLTMKSSLRPNRCFP